jgi:hypothetical protein
MAYEYVAVETIVQHLQRKAQDVANVVVGPRREGWFNSESIVALSSASDLEKFVVHGEQGYRMVQKDGATTVDQDYGRSIPDVVGYLSDGVPAFVMEAKVLHRSDSQSARAASLTRLLEQLREAKLRCPDAATIGMLYLACLSSDPPNDRNTRTAPDSFYSRIGLEFETLAADLRPSWVRVPSGIGAIAGLSTTFDFPRVHVWLGIGAVSV